MQPYFLPHLGYFQLVNCVDKFIFYDNVNFIKGGWINRNKFRKDIYFRIPIKNQSQKLSDSVLELSQLSQNNLEVQNKIDELSKSFLLLEETVQAFDSYRRQNNEMLQEMQLEISSINMSNTP